MHRIFAVIGDDHRSLPFFGEVPYLLHYLRIDPVAFIHEDGRVLPGNIKLPIFKIEEIYAFKALVELFQFCGVGAQMENAHFVVAGYLHRYVI